MFTHAASRDLRHQMDFLDSQGAGEPTLSAFSRILDEIDYGIVLADAAGRVQHMNHLARHEVATGGVLRLVSGCLEAVDADQIQSVGDAINRAALGHRTMLKLAAEGLSLTAVFVPLGHPLDSSHASVLVMFSKRQVCSALMIRFFAELHGLTSAEQVVLRDLCEGKPAEEIASSQGIAVSTVRSHINRVREKTGSRSIRQVVTQVFSLPPMVPALKGHGGPRQ